jgi:hypothetical protein
MNRRIFLRGIGGTAVAAPFLSSLWESKAGAQAATPPKRLVIFYTHNGVLTNRWFPKLDNGALTDAALEGTLDVLKPYKSKLLVPRGLKSLNPYAVGQSTDPHDQACGSKLTCAPISSASNRYATAASLDHEIAKAINPGAKTPLVLSVGAASTNIKEVISFSAKETAFPATVNPTTVFNQLTGVFGTGGNTGGPSPATWQFRRGQSIIDLIRGDLGRFQSLRMSNADRGRVTDWLDLLKTTEDRLRMMMMTGGGGAAACTKMTAESMPLGLTEANLKSGTVTGPVTAGNVLGPRSTPEGDANLATSFTLGGDLMLNLIALNMICDSNRVLLMVWPGYVIFNWDGIKHQNEHHGLSHRTGNFEVGGNCRVDGVLDKLNEIDRWYAKKYAKLVGLLDSIGEGSGTLLDSTATVWLPEVSDGAAHNLNNLPIVVAGSLGGYLKQGEVVNLETAKPDPGKSDSTCMSTGGSIGFTGSSGGNVPINKFYVTLMNGLGMRQANGAKIDKFGMYDTDADFRAGAGTQKIGNPGELTKLITGTA